ncbi:superinfection exclusion B family protein [Paenibacillus polymyxa]|uniref:superinfection exclusion B family protein n=1 Tax=Paenibacillus polymyxa TaxID=1406 RepID=UPI002AB57E73|nr:superinfection exclusion B family protein [Paenibacillus polymyxa]MDY7989880.1 superinfection exclusion B family protein [Paenibacillus polymyxa]MDY8116761.1 superinfection exclusion B family protein [Paenibacillus polymyxa]
MLEAFLTKAIDFVKLGTKHLLILFVVTGLALSLPNNLLGYLKLQHLVETYRSWIGGVFLVSGVIVMINIVQNTFNVIFSAKSSRKNMKLRKEKLRRLTPKEKLILMRYFALNTTSQDLPVNDGVVNELAAYGIISRTSTLSSWGVNFSYNIQPWARGYLDNNPELLYVNEAEERIIKQEIEKEEWDW